MVALNKCDVTRRHADAARRRHPARAMVCVAARSEVALLEARAAGRCEYVEGGSVVTMLPSEGSGSGGANGAEDGIGGGDGGGGGGAAAAAADAPLARAQAVLGSVGTTGTLDALSAAVLLRPPTLAFPVASLSTLEPLRAPPDAAAPASGAAGASAAPLLDCVLLKPCTTVGDLVEACKRASPPLLSGDFVRAEGRAARPADEQAAKGLPVRKDAVVKAAVAIMRLQTNRRSQWQR